MNDIEFEKRSDRYLEFFYLLYKGKLLESPMIQCQKIPKSYLAEARKAYQTDVVFHAACRLNMQLLLGGVGDRERELFK